MRVNGLKPAPGAKHPKKRVGRGIGSGLGKTAGRGHKGQKARAGGFHKLGFEGGQMPLQRRLPKRGFISLTKEFRGQVRTADLERLAVEVVDLLTLKQAGLVPNLALSAKVFLSGKLTKKLTLRGVAVTAGAKSAIEAAGGTIAP